MKTPAALALCLSLLAGLIPLNPGNYQMQLMYGFNRCSFQIRAGHTTTIYYAYGSINGEVTYD